MNGSHSVRFSFLDQGTPATQVSIESNKVIAVCDLLIDVTYFDFILYTSALSMVTR